MCKISQDTPFMGLMGKKNSGKIYINHVLALFVLLQGTPRSLFELISKDPQP